MSKLFRTVGGFGRKVNSMQRQNAFPREGNPRRGRNLVLSLFVLMALCWNAPLRAGNQVPFKGYFIPVVRSTTPVDATHVRLEFDVQVQATLLGNAQGPASAILDLTTFAYVGVANWIAPNGDAVSITFEGQFVPTVNPDVLENIETFEVTGGTGRFQGATGSGVAAGQLDAATLLPLGKGAPFVGTISSPGSLKKK